MSDCELPSLLDGFSSDKMKLPSQGSALSAGAKETDFGAQLIRQENEIAREEERKITLARRVRRRTSASYFADQVNPKHAGAACPARPQLRSALRTRTQRNAIGPVLTHYDLAQRYCRSRRAITLCGGKTDRMQLAGQVEEIAAETAACAAYGPTASP